MVGVPPSQRFKLIPAVYLILRQGNNVLLSLRQNTGYADGWYSLVAGHLDGGEYARAGLVREVFEEAGLTIAPDHLQLRLVMHRFSSDRESVDFFFEATEWSGEIRNMEPEKCKALTFFPLDRFPDNLLPYVREMFDAIARGEVYLERGFGENELA